MIFPDNEAKVDLLNNEYVAVTIKNLLLERVDEPLTIGIHGDWGAGKSSVLGMLEQQLRDDADVLCIRFDGWRFQGFEDAKISMLEIITTELLENKKAVKKVADKAKALLRRIDWFKVAKYGGNLAITAVTGLPTPEQINMAVSAVKGLISDPTKLVDPSKIKTALDSAGGILKPSEDVKRIPVEIREFRKDFELLLDEAGIKRLVVLVDDLDRCLPKTIIETLEAIRLFLFTKKTAFVIAADERMITYAVQEHFPNLPVGGKEKNSRQYTDNYLEKLIQIPFRLPLLGESETRIYVSLLLVGSQLDEDDEQYSKLIEVAREKMRAPWASSGITTADISKTFNKKVREISDMVILSNRISSSLARGSDGNPRQIKRFLNTLLLRNEIAEARGFKEQVKLPSLAKLMLAERFHTELYDLIIKEVGESSNGTSSSIKALETKTGIKQTIKTKDKQDSHSDKSDSENKLLCDERAVAWSIIEPNLTDLDLRPYLLVSREDKSLFRKSVEGGGLLELANSLFAPKLVLQKYRQEIMDLSPTEANDVFDLICERIMIEGEFTDEPPGFDGMKFLVKEQSHLAGKVVDFLDSLQESGLGIWITRGWGGIVNGTVETQRLKKTFERWASQSDNKKLSVAAKLVLESRKD